jgi:hypothetical protein
MKKFTIELDEKEIEMMEKLVDWHDLAEAHVSLFPRQDIYATFVSEETFLRSLLNKILTEKEKK